MISASGTGVSSDVITITPSPYYSSSTISTVNITGTGGTFTLGSGISDTSSTYSWTMPEEWVDSFPMWTRIQDMCEQYPGLKIAFENFKTVYQLVKDDYDTPKDEK